MTPPRSALEGVESEAARTILLEMGCRHAQGYLFSPPVPGERILELLTELCDRDPAPAPRLLRSRG
jgi:EAL domain-containing protein (putative c-di-GMP-specific phosphodiesterase class I)